jgi:hypothetical protein
MNTDALLQVMPWLGWVLLLLGWLGQRRNVQNWINKVMVIGSHNHVSNQVSYTPPKPDSTQAPALVERIGSWASILGLLLTLWPLLKSTGAAWS